MIKMLSLLSHEQKKDTMRFILLIVIAFPLQIFAGSSKNFFENTQRKVAQSQGAISDFKCSKIDYINSNRIEMFLIDNCALDKQFSFSSLPKLNENKERTTICCFQK